MKELLVMKMFATLRRGYDCLTSEAKDAVREFVKSQCRDGGYVNAGGEVDEYYTQFGRLLSIVFSPMQMLRGRVALTVKESEDKNTAYGIFFRFLDEEMHHARHGEIEWGDVKTDTTNAVCCKLCIQSQMGEAIDDDDVWLLVDMQEDNGGFRANAVAPIPDLLSTAVGLFTMRIIGRTPIDASDFLNAHWLDEGGFAPTIFDDYSDVEYVFYGLLALGALH